MIDECVICETVAPVVRVNGDAVCADCVDECAMNHNADIAGVPPASVYDDPDYVLTCHDAGCGANTPSVCDRERCVCGYPVVPDTSVTHDIAAGVWLAVWVVAMIAMMAMLAGCVSPVAPDTTDRWLCDGANGTTHESNRPCR